jgi:aldose 1-epimerase
VTVVELSCGDLSARISTRGGILLGFWWNREGTLVPLLREAPGDDADARASSCYPLVPFGNRVRDNRFRFNGKDYRLSPNTDWDKHYLHGEGWQADWRVAQQDASSVDLVFDQTADDRTPYGYAATQRFSLRGGALELTLSVANRGGDPLPFGLGWHPYFPMTPKTTLFAPARKYWTEVDGWLPGEATDIPVDVDFNKPRELPHRWVNNGFENWCGEAQIVWPERKARLLLTADQPFRHAFLFVSDSSFDPAFARDYFCFEPMTHLANGHNLPDLGDLTVLKQDEILAGSIRMRPSAWTDQ